MDEQDLRIARLAEREGARRVISLDPNLRPVLIGDLEKGKYLIPGTPLAGLAIPKLLLQLFSPLHVMLQSPYVLCHWL